MTRQQSMTSGQRASRTRARAKTRVKFERNIRIRIWVYPEDGRWIAQSGRLTLIGEGETPAEAVDSLIRAIHLFAETALSRGWLTQFERQLPLRQRVALYLKVFASRLHVMPAGARTLTRG